MGYLKCISWDTSWSGLRPKRQTPGSELGIMQRTMPLSWSADKKTQYPGEQRMEPRPILTPGPFREHQVCLSVPAFEDEALSGGGVPKAYKKIAKGETL